MLTTECQQWCSPVGTVSIHLPAHLQCRDILISCSLLHLCFTCWDLYKSPPQRTRQTQFATALSLMFYLVCYNAKRGVGYRCMMIRKSL